MIIWKKFISATSLIVLSSSSIVTITACTNSNTRIDSKISEDLQSRNFLEVVDLTNKNNITGQAIYDKFKNNIIDYGFNAIKEIIARNEFISIFAKMNGENFKLLSDEKVKEYQAKFTALWDDIAGNILYQQYLNSRLENSFLEITVMKKGFDIVQSNDWHILGTWDDANNTSYKTTVQPDFVDLMDTTKDYKTKTISRFKEYYDAEIRPQILDNLMTMSWLQDRMFEFKNNAYHFNKNWIVPKNVQTFDFDNVWDSKIKMVWETKNKDSALLPTSAGLTPNEALKDKFKPETNEVKTIFDPVFNMAGFRGFVGYNNDNSTYGSNTMDDFYKEEVKETQITGFAHMVTPNGAKIEEFYIDSRRYASKIYVLPIFWIDLVKNYKINNKTIVIDSSLEYQWKNGRNKNDTKLNSERWNQEIQNLDNNMKTTLINQILYTISQKDNFKKEAAKHLYTKYIVSNKNIYDVNIWNKISSYFEDEEY